MRQMKRFVLAVGVVGLAGAALSGAACWRVMGSGSFDQRACSGAHFSLVQAMLPNFDYVELRDTTGEGGEARVLERAGAKCSGATDPEACAKTIEEATSTGGWNNGSNGRMPGHHYIVASKGDVVTVVTDKNLVEVLAPIDTPVKAALVSAIQRNIFPSCERSVRQRDGKYEIHLVSTSCFGPVDEVVSVDPAGQLNVIESHREPGTCVGSRGPVPQNVDSIDLVWNASSGLCLARNLHGGS